MNAAMVSAWNGRVSPNDNVWFLGDLSWTVPTARDVFPKLSGKKHLIVGNHDQKEIRKLPWDSVQYATRIKVDGLKIFLCHYPVRGFREDLHFHGHEHGAQPPYNDRAIDVGVDVIGYAPASLAEIKGILSRRVKVSP
jgi:calcineurin-like phosphoesterase family protein